MGALCLRQINTCRTVPFYIFKWRNFALPSMRLIFLRLCEYVSILNFVVILESSWSTVYHAVECVYGSGIEHRGQSITTLHSMSIQIGLPLTIAVSCHIVLQSERGRHFKCALNDSIWSENLGVKYVDLFPFSQVLFGIVNNILLTCISQFVIVLNFRTIVANNSLSNRILLPNIRQMLAF